MLCAKKQNKTKTKKHNKNLASNFFRIHYIKAVNLTIDIVSKTLWVQREKVIKTSE